MLHGREDSGRIGGQAALRNDGIERATTPVRTEELLERERTLLC